MSEIIPIEKKAILYFKPQLKPNKRGYHKILIKVLKDSITVQEQEIEEEE
ncbi:hypothetical protein LCGC14_0547690 [marine sediment metagenome]|uniref:Uncharacterized protein n=1 Tax=marine sediment metagenome TaxID=412755 RepID=A0A0F9S9D6_9ZZZZ